MSGRYGGQKGDVCYSHMTMSWRKDIKESNRIKSFLFLFILIELWDLYYSNIFLRVKIDEEASLCHDLAKQLSYFLFLFLFI